MSQDIIPFSENSLQGYTAARHGAGLIDRTDRGRLVVSGRDRATFLQGLLTNDVVALDAGQGCYAAYLTPQGRMITDMLVYELGDVMLLTMGADLKDRMLTRLDQLVFAEDVQLGDVTERFNGTAIVGPEAARAVAATLSKVSEAGLKNLPVHGNARAEFDGGGAM